MSSASPKRLQALRHAAAPLCVYCEQGKKKIENEAFTKFEVDVAVLCDIII
jgi:hypothetical protein